MNDFTSSRSAQPVPPLDALSCLKAVERILISAHHGDDNSESLYVAKVSLRLIETALDGLEVR